MRTPYTGFIDGTGQLASPQINAERTVNLYPEIVDAGTGKSRAWLRGTPGLKPFATAGSGPIRAVVHQDGRTFCVSGSGFYEVFSDGTSVLRGIVIDDSNGAHIALNGNIGRQAFVVSGMLGSIFRLDTNAFAPIVSAGFPPTCLSGLFADSYFLALWSGAPKFSFSSLADGTTWAALDVAQKSQTSDNILAWIYDHKELWLLGSQKTEVWANSGDARNPWAPQPILIESGIGASDSLAQGDDSIFWLRSDSTGGGTVVRASGYQTIDISSHALETALGQYSRIDDAIGYFYKRNGHGFYVLTLPTAQATWVYDVTTQRWHEWLYWNSRTGVYEAHLGRCHAYAWSKNLVGSRVDGQIYELSDTTYTDAGAPIRRLRRAPHVAKMNAPLTHNSLEVDFHTGVGLTSGQGVDPKVSLRCSDDGGKTWGNEIQASLGVEGDYGQLVYWDRLGQARKRVYEVVVTDPVFCGINEAYVDIEEDED